MTSDDRAAPTESTQVAPAVRAGRTAARWVRRTFVPADSGPATDWAAVRVGSGAERPDELPDEDALSITRTFCFADLSGFTRYTREYGPHEAVELLAEFRRITRSVAARRGVRVAKWLGDGVMMVGVEPAPVLAAGAHLVHVFDRHDLAVRVGVATGTALLFEGDDYIGEPVNLAAKLCAAAEPGELLAICEPDDLPDWVHDAGGVSVRIRGVGTLDDIVRLVPDLGDAEVVDEVLEPESGNEPTPPTLLPTSPGAGESPLAPTG